VKILHIICHGKPENTSAES
jgi:hypothetical protein